MNPSAEAVKTDPVATAESSWKWLSSTLELQEHTYGYDMMELLDAHHRGEKDLVQYLDWNATAIVQEVAELREEFSWKPWATDKPFVMRERIIKESVDALHFFGNILAALGVTDEEFWGYYQHKQEINRQRVASGNYSARKGGLAEGSD